MSYTMTAEAALAGAQTAATEHLLAKSRWHKAWLVYWGRVEPLTDAEAFPLLEEFRKQVQVYRFDYKRKENGVKQAANEMFRLVCVGKSPHGFDKLRRFARWYGKLKGRIDKAVAHLFDYHGDSFGDLCDLLPLACEAVVQKCLASEKGKGNPRAGYLTEQELREGVDDLGKPWGDFILGGEEYVASALEKQAENWFLYEVRDETKWTRQQESELSFYETDDED